MISAGVKSNIKQQEVKDLWLYFTNYYKSTFKTSNTMSYSRKKNKQGIWRHTGLKAPLKFFVYLVYPWKL